jgi:hypothetical protein
MKLLGLNKTNLRTFRIAGALHSKYTLHLTNIIYACLIGSADNTQRNNRTKLERRDMIDLGED